MAIQSMSGDRRNVTYLDLLDQICGKDVITSYSIHYTKLYDSLYDSRSKIRVEASLALAVWHMSLGTPEGRITARRYLEQAKASRRDRGWLRKLAALQLHCDYALGDIAGAERTHAEFTRLGALTPAALLAWANCQPSLRTRVEVFNRALSAHKVSPVALSDDPHRFV